jgi:hypothetical protein
LEESLYTRVKEKVGDLRYFYLSHPLSSSRSHSSKAKSAESETERKSTPSSQSSQHSISVPLSLKDSPSPSTKSTLLSEQVFTCGVCKKLQPRDQVSVSVREQDTDDAFVLLETNLPRSLPIPIPVPISISNHR